MNQILVIEKPLNPRQLAFVDEFILTLNATQAYKNVYKCKLRVADANGARLLADARIGQMIKDRQKDVNLSRVLSIQQIKEFWTNIVLDAQTPLIAKLKASEFLAKSGGAFIERLEVSSNATVNVTIFGTDD